MENKRLTSVTTIHFRHNGHQTLRRKIVAENHSRNRESAPAHIFESVAQVKIALPLIAERLGNFTPILKSCSAVEAKLDEDGDELGGGEAMLAAKRRLFRCWSVSEDEDDVDGDEDVGWMSGKIGSGTEEFVRLANMLRSGHFPLNSISRTPLFRKTFFF